MRVEDVTNGALALGLPAVAAALLTSLVIDGPASQAALTARLAVAPSSICRTVRLLDEMGLVETQPLRRQALVRAVPFTTSLPALAERQQRQLSGVLDRVVAACALLGVTLDLPTPAQPAAWAVQPLPVCSSDPPYVVPATGFTGGDLHWRLSAAHLTRDVVLSARGPGLQAPGAQQMLAGRPKTVRVVVMSGDRLDQQWRRRLRDYVTGGVDVRVDFGPGAPFTIVDRQRACLSVLVAGEQRRVWVQEVEQLASLMRLFEALWEDADTLST